MATKRCSVVSDLYVPSVLFVAPDSYESHRKAAPLSASCQDYFRLYRPQSTVAITLHLIT